jgi:RimJ/RimL family protein N-acetyltransferase
MTQHIPTLENSKVRLQPLDIKDVEPLAEIALSQPHLFELMSQQFNTKGDVYGYVRKALDDMNAGIAIAFLVIDKATGKIAGTTRFLNIVKEHKRLEIGGTWLSKDFHNNGVNKAMKFLMLQYAFQNLQMHRVELKTAEINHISRRAIESIGATFEGILRHHMINDNGTPRNSVYYSILKDEWPEIKENVFKKHQVNW